MSVLHNLPRPRSCPSDLRAVADGAAFVIPPIRTRSTNALTSLAMTKRPLLSGRELRRELFAGSAIALSAVAMGDMTTPAHALSDVIVSETTGALFVPRPRVIDRAFRLRKWRLFVILLLAPIAMRTLGYVGVFAVAGLVMGVMGVG